MNHQQQQQEQGSFGLTRYKSAPSSYFSTLFSSDDGFGGDDFDNLFNTRASIPQTDENENFPRFMDSVTDQQLQRHESNDFSSVSHMMYQSQPQQGYNSEAATSSPLNVDRVDQTKINGGINNLIRHSSSPAGFFANFKNEIDEMRGVGNFRGGISTNGQTSMLSFKTMKPIDEMGSKTSGQLEEDGNKNGGYITNFPATSSSDHQNNDNQNRRPIPLSHHLSLPKDPAVVYEMLSPDAVPCRTRAKRGFATHPRSIAERVRRTKISERMRRLQELVPNMDNQTSTSDMLDLAVDYIKDLQVQVKRLSDTQAKCTCSAGERT